jgi:hypothetical protein
MFVLIYNYLARVLYESDKKLSEILLITERIITMKKKISAFVTSLALLASYAAVMPASTVTAANALPSSFDLSDNTTLFPREPFDQGNEGSCVASSITYYQFTYHAREAILKNDPTADVSSLYYSPASIYPQINRGVDEGSWEHKAYKVLKNRGALTLDVAPYDRINDISTYDKVTGEYLSTPTAINYVYPRYYEKMLNEDERKSFEEVYYNGAKRYRRIGEYISREKYESLPEDNKRFYVPVYENGDSDTSTKTPELYWHIAMPYRAIPRDENNLFNALNVRIDSYEGFDLYNRRIPESGSRSKWGVSDQHEKEDLFINKLKEELYNGNVVSTSTYFNYDLGMKKVWPEEDNSEYAVYQNYKQYGSYSGHQFTIVGYDDSIECDINGDKKIDEKTEKGAFKVVNTWGNWANKGYVWVMYDAVREHSDNKICEVKTIYGETSADNQLYHRTPAFGECYTIKVSQKDIKLVSEVDVFTDNYYSVSVDNYCEGSETVSNDIEPQTNSVVVYSGPIFSDITKLAEGGINDKYYTIKTVNNHSYNAATRTYNKTYAKVKAVRLKDDKGNVISEAVLTNGDAFTNNSENGESYEYTLGVHIQKGDLNYDGELDQNDLAKIDEYFNIINYRNSDEAKNKEIKEKFSAFQLELLDADNDGVINMDDYNELNEIINS